MAAPADGSDLETSLLSFEKLDRASPDLWPEQQLGSLTTANLMEKVRGLQNLAYQLGLDEYLPRATHPSLQTSTEPCQPHHQKQTSSSPEHSKRIQTMP
ncbi:protein lin-52 homolog isoform X7 [Alligator mississippiensis]|uniref:protein lin-52 homolog isoform X7 n=1 Tax=Alligator mississippiensis TaxID=8496 RepID=UPI002877E39D|nr:protein lin-52 homolog isoform X7 [Alligator mississippiensis]